MNGVVPYQLGYHMSHSIWLKPLKELTWHESKSIISKQSAETNNVLHIYFMSLVEHGLHRQEY